MDAVVVEVFAETAKSFEVLIESTFSERSSCWLCSRTITNAKSLRWGVGPDCAATLGLPWESPPEDNPEYIETNRKRLYLAKSLITPEQSLTLAAYAQTKRTNEPIQKSHIWIEDSFVILKAPFVNKKFVDELKQIDGRTWDFKEKVTKFPKSESSVAKLCAVLKRWGMTVSMDDESERLLKNYADRERSTSAALSEMGVDETGDLKFSDIPVENYDWGLADGVLPWAHQAQAIMFAATMMGIKVPEKRS